MPVVLTLLVVCTNVVDSEISGGSSVRLTLGTVPALVRVSRLFAWHSIIHPITCCVACCELRVETSTSSTSSTSSASSTSRSGVRPSGGLQASHTHSHFTPSHSQSTSIAYDAHMLTSCPWRLERHDWSEENIDSFDGMHNFYVTAKQECISKSALSEDLLDTSSTGDHLPHRYHIVQMSSSAACMM